MGAVSPESATTLTATYCLPTGRIVCSCRLPIERTAREQARRSRTGHAGSPDPQDVGPPADERLVHRRAAQGGVVGRAAREHGLSVPSPSQAGATGLDSHEMAPE